MNSELRQESEPSLNVPEGVGPTLRRLREAKGLSRNDVCERLKFSTRQLEALESERWDELPSGLSLRGFARNYARYLNTDVDAIMSMLDHQLGTPQPGYVAPRRPVMAASGDIPMHDVPPRRPWGWLALIVGLLLVASYYAVQGGWIPESWLIFDWLQALKNDG